MKSTVKLVLSILIFAAILLIPIALGLYIVQQAGGQPSTPGTSIETSSWEKTLIGLYLQLRKADLEKPASSASKPVTFTVHPGETATDIALRLEQAGLITDAGLFRLLVRYQGLESALEAGDYELRTNMTMTEALTKLQHGQLRTVSVTIPEGWRAEEIAAMLSQQGAADGNEFLKVVRSGNGFDYAFLRDRPKGASTSLEGFLFPDTYKVPPAMDARSFVNLMLQNFDRKLTPQMRQGIAAQKLTIYEAVILASIVEREAVVADERPVIAGVFLNRLNKKTILNADPTVQYALGYQADKQTWWKRPLLLDDLAFDSPYNTYLHAGLPPGPICNPGAESLQAVAFPAQTDYLYFVAKGDGSHAFARTLDEHKVNIQKYQGQTP